MWIANSQASMRHAAGLVQPAWHPDTSKQSTTRDGDLVMSSVIRKLELVQATDDRPFALGQRLSFALPYFLEDGDHGQCVCTTLRRRLRLYLKTCTFRTLAAVCPWVRQEEKQSEPILTSMLDERDSPQPNDTFLVANKFRLGSFSPRS